jgi:hypothetical protein
MAADITLKPAKRTAAIRVCQEIIIAAPHEPGVFTVFIYDFGCNSVWLLMLINALLNLFR